MLTEINSVRKKEKINKDKKVVVEIWGLFDKAGLKKLLKYIQHFNHNRFIIYFKQS